MPTYEYVCPSCGNQFDQYVSFQGDPNSVHCASCGSTVRRVFSKPSIVFKGSGFYINDSRPKSGIAEKNAS